MIPGRVVVLGGKRGLLGMPLTRTLTEAGYEVVPTGRDTLDVFDESAVARLLNDFKPDYVFNTIAYTAVDQAEDEPVEAAKLNKTLPRLLGQICLDHGSCLVHYSTDFVFDGTKTEPYVETDPVNPQSVYGKTKLEGELALADMGMEHFLCLRTAWLFGPGKINFVEKILGYARERDVLRIVHDQVGSPTSTIDLSSMSLALIKANARGLFHTVGGGKASWCELTSEAVAAAGVNCRVEPIMSDEFPQKAKRPAYSVLSTQKLTEVTGFTPRPWVQSLREYVYGFLA
ncbi:dTDP-4-dehydrorhamnose reductase [Desulfovibrio inopinatus]|uniref:dTDP-4-dehydrorhamnose reductase n=1 Tax=Desulfovibrio inopinatus TaxID=102109 RepID=UPI00041349B9|nr:dTDP-4-dehydrorhamnose reductase [Desulfovibrio inopinatus]